MTGAMITFDIDVSELLRLAAAIPALAQALDEEGGKAMEDSGMMLTLMVKGRMTAEHGVNYGTLRSSISWPQGFEKQGSLLDTLRGIVGASNMMSGSGMSTSTYVWYVEEGTSPHWPPAGPLKLWALRKFGDERIGYMVQRSIAAKGTRGVHMFQRAWDEGGQAGVERIWGQVAVKAVARFEKAAS